jgi:hypothetical protein
MKKAVSDQIAKNPTQFNIAAIAKLEEEARQPGSVFETSVCRQQSALQQSAGDKGSASISFPGNSTGAWCISWSGRRNDRL